MVIAEPVASLPNRRYEIREIRSEKRSSKN